MKIPENYELIKKERVEELGADAYLLRHNKTGARVLAMECEDDNKVFAIGFRTPISDSTGVPHIIEHSVLCGSRKYPVQDPFMQLAKSSLNTFLNAMTFPDKTVYPVASCNDKDLANLMSVYLDAVFYPNIYTNKKIFEQEGWHYALSDKDEKLDINGVVYSEMKGAFSDPEECLDRYCQNSLYPDTGYGFESGGDPDVIPTLSYEQFIDFHSKYYHPSNSYIFLYGNMDMEERLTWIDNEYLSHFDAIDIDSRIKFQQPFESKKDLKLEYPIAEGEDTDGKFWDSLQWSVGKGTDTRLCVAMQVLEYALLGSEGAPLKEAILKSGICEDVFGGIMTDIYQPFFKITAKGTSEDSKDRFIKLVYDSLGDIVNKGLDKTSLEAALNSLEFRTREADFGGYPKGIIYMINAFSSWLYDDEAPVSYLKYDADFRFLRESINTDYYEQLIKNCFIENNHCSFIKLTPHPGLTEEKEKALAEKLAAYKAELSDAELDAIIAETKALEEYQSTPDTAEALASLPHLELSDISEDFLQLSTQELSMENTPVLFHKAATGGITYMNFMYDISDLEPEEITDAALLRTFLGLLDTKKHTYGELSDQISLSFGGMDMSIQVRANSNDSFISQFEIVIKYLHGKQNGAAKLLDEIIHDTCYTDKTRLAELIRQYASRNEMSIAGTSHSIAINRAFSYETPLFAYQELISGIDYIRQLDRLAKDADASAGILLERLAKMANKLFTSDRLRISITDTEDGLNEAISAFKPYFAGDAYVPRENKFPFKPEKRNEGFKTTGQVNYNALCGTIEGGRKSYTGALRVLKSILSMEYLWTNLRVKGGAYGTLCTFTRTGRAGFVSYRDPNLSRTYEVYKGLPDYIASFDADERKMTDTVISVIGAAYGPVSPATFGSTSLAAYLSGLTNEMRRIERQQIINCKPADIRALAPLIKGVIDKWQICTVGGSGSIEAESAQFNKTENIL